MVWKKIKPLEKPPESGCLNCGSKPSVLPMNWILIFYGSCVLTKDKKSIWDMPFGQGEGKYENKPWTLQKLENIAKKDPEHDWRLSIDIPLWSGVWQRQGDKQWVAIENGMGLPNN